MKRFVYLIAATTILASCGEKTVNKTEELTKLKRERADLDKKISALEGEVAKTTPTKGTPVSTMTVTRGQFDAYVDVQGQVTGDQNILATSQAPGIVKSITVRPGQQVGKGQTLAILDASVVEQQIQALEPQISLTKALYEKQQKLWAQNIGTEVQLLSAKASYEGVVKQKSALQAQRAMYTIKSPISGTVDAVDIKPGDAVNPGMNGIKVVNMAALKATASLGENYLGKVKQGDPVKLVFVETGDTINSKLSYVARAIDPISRAFKVEVNLGSNAALHPNMSCRMQIANYRNKTAIAVPVRVIQKTSEGDLVYIVDGNKAKVVRVVTGRTSDGMIEIVSGLKDGDVVITEGFENLDNGEAVALQ
ncbi:efflux RND transporter periplasmic adaptor subunit [Polluticoccus soli]|uniref:efflux RND transporter periplasmic adaptor subunit n=1 Tax=Polluticoccus soli TaxID=3034150 RepID=UPI0023E0B9A7|nr:efflux RND transporter periplasmic adaptor subunit [Flavipsychrobacter sp. JY13-12]